MRRYFNTEGTCNPRRHYMVDIRERLEAIKTRYIERGRCGRLFKKRMGRFGSGAAEKYAGCIVYTDQQEL